MGREVLLKPLEMMLCVGGLMMVSHGVFAQSSELNTAHRFRISGFGSLSETYADSDTLGFRRDMSRQGHSGHWDMNSDSLLGLQFDASISDSLRSSVQFVAQDRPSNTLNTVTEWAYLAYQPNDEWFARLGRVAIDSTLTAGYGNVAYAYDWVRSPVEFYGFIPIYGLDGVDISYRIPINNGSWNVKFYLGQSEKSLSSDISFDISPITGLMAEYQSNHFIYKGTVTYTELNNFSFDATEQLLTAAQYDPFFDPDAYQRLQLSGLSVWYFTSGAMYQSGNWKWVSELAYADFSEGVFLPIISGYLGTSYRIAPEWALYGIVSGVKSTENVYQVKSQGMLSAGAQQMLDFYDAEQSTMSLGWRWDVYSNTALKFQWDSTWVEKNKATLWSRVSDQTESQRIDVFTISLNFVF